MKVSRDRLRRADRDSRRWRVVRRIPTGTPGASSRFQTRAIRGKSGFTLIETMIATGIMLAALLAVASIFAYSARTNMLNQQRTMATLLANSKLEDLAATSPIDNLIVGGGLDGANPTPNYVEYVSLTTSGVLTVDVVVNVGAPYMRLWQISGDNLRLITVAVFAQRSGVSGERTELIRATTNLTNGF